LKLTSKEWIGLWLLVNLFGVGVYDLVAFKMIGPEATVSSVLRSWSRDFPELLLAVGYLICHLFARF